MEVPFKSAFTWPHVPIKKAAIIVRHIIGFVLLLIFDLLSILKFLFEDFFSGNMPVTMGLRTMSAAPSDSQCNALRDSTSIPPLAQVVAAHRQEPPASVCRFPRWDSTRKQVARR